MKKVTWQVGVQSMPGAFRGDIETPIRQVEEPAKPLEDNPDQRPVVKK
jgi:hypothetical protein